MTIIVNSKLLSQNKHYLHHMLWIYFSSANLHSKLKTLQILIVKGEFFLVSIHINEYAACSTSSGAALLTMSLHLFCLLKRTGIFYSTIINSIQTSQLAEHRFLVSNILGEQMIRVLDVQQQMLTTYYYTRRDNTARVINNMSMNIVSTLDICIMQCNHNVHGPVELSVRMKGSGVCHDN